MGLANLTGAPASRFPRREAGAHLRPGDGEALISSQGIAPSPGSSRILDRVSTPPDDGVRPPGEPDTGAAGDHDHAWSLVKQPHDVESLYRDTPPVLLYRCDVCGITWSLDR
jgi:hypothetical protein